MGHIRPDWYERGKALASARGKLKLFKGDWHPGGPMAYVHEKQAAALGDMVNRYADEIRLETTRELLSTVFALGDGRDVTWGDATVEQHEQRITMLTKNAAGIVETASRHRAAIRMITESGAKCLSELAPEEAA